jgi:hypothetical protein
MKSSPNSVGAPASHYRVYYPAEADLYLADGVPLYLNLVIATEENNLFLVPAEEGGWWKRSEFTGSRDELKQVDPRETPDMLSFVGAINIRKRAARDGIAANVA